MAEILENQIGGLDDHIILLFFFGLVFDLSFCLCDTGVPLEKCTILKVANLGFNLKKGSDLSLTTKIYNR
ncbi:hypothetical protein BpHYR1_040664 [Brachionus plicatilis]|uniref:Uncharacterized protein n=1 Tax=Brachionus plicatilis TaxID=10195 RepID=A0A3M7RMT1_BRAPC|nr:hypothetical protein BpHYR1_040664 [Brachionus plicatilis]